MYHSVGDNGLFFTTGFNDFKRQLSYLNEKKINVISLFQLFEYLENKKEIPKKTIVLTFDDGYEDNYTNVFPILKKYNFPAAIFLTVGIVGAEKDKHGLKMLDWEQIKKMNDSGLIDFEPHTVSHQKLSKIDLVDAEKEILESKKIIEEKLNKKCAFFAYPFGNYNEKIIGIAKNNFKLGLTVKGGRADLSSDLCEIKRNSIDSATTFNQFKYIIK